MERHLVASFAERFGYRPEQAEGTFATGGAEANHTAVLTALTRAFPEYLRHGVKSLRAQPVLYISSEGHDSLPKAARMCGLGTESVREIAVDGSLRMSTELLRQQIQEDLEEGFAPFLIVGTAGTTGAGTIDPLPELVEIAAEEGIWLHVDAAWGGAAVLVPELGAALQGIEQSDSITFDAHKWLSVPMGAGLYLTRHPQILAVSMQWSRRFIGLKVFLSLAVAGWEGYEEAIRHQTAMGHELRQELDSHGWRVVNETPLPVVCFVDRTRPVGDSPEFLDQISRTIIDSGEAWISTARLGTSGTALRACITNYRTSSEDIAALVAALNRARSSVS
jgi:glutamate/tyrosine decarboxylase-like PLP-dependent enzyme